MSFSIRKQPKAAAQKSVADVQPDAEPTFDPATTTIWTEGVAPEWVAKTNELIALNERDEALAEELRTIERGIERTLAIDFSQADHMRYGKETRHPEPAPAPKLGARARRLLGLPDEPPAPPPPPKPTDDDLPAVKFADSRWERMAEISRDRAAIAEAQEVLRQQIAVAKREASQRIALICKPHYDTLVARMANAAAELAMAKQAHDAFLAMHRNAEVAWFKIPATELLMTRADVREFVITCASSGHTQLSDVPAEIINKP